MDIYLKIRESGVGSLVYCSRNKNVTSSWLLARIPVIFFYFDLFWIIILEMNPVKHFFSNMAIFSHVSSSDATYKGVTPIWLVRLGVLTCERQPTWRHVGWKDWVTPQQTARLKDAPSCDVCPPVAPSAVAWLNRASQIDTTSSYLKPASASSSSLSFSHAQATTTATNFTDTAGLPPSPLTLELRSSTSPKVDHF
jgi:hypothetical protein